MKKILFMAIVLAFSFQLSPSFAGETYSDRDRERELDYLKSSLDSATRSYWAIPSSERPAYKYSFDQYCSGMQDKIRLLEWDPEQYFFEKRERERSKARRIIIE